MKKYQKRGRLLIVPDEIAQKDIDHVVIDGNGLMDSWHVSQGVRYTDKRTAHSPCSHRRPLDCGTEFAQIAGAMISAIKFISIPVRDQKRALDFYTEKLGFTIITDQPFDDKQRWIELRIPKAETRVVLFTPDGWDNRVGSFSGISYATDDIQATYTEYASRGVKFRGRPEKKPWGTFAIFEDSEGNQFVLSTPK